MAEREVIKVDREAAICLQIKEISGFRIYKRIYSKVSAVQSEGLDMERVSAYWHVKMPIPPEDKEKIRSMVKGEEVKMLSVGDSTVQLLKVNGNVFRNVFVANRAFLFKGDYTAPPGENDYLDADNYLTADGLAGFSVTHDGWLVSLYSNYSEGGFAKAVKEFIVGKAYKLVCIVADTVEGNGLVELYSSVYGFRKYARTINDIKVMREHYGDEFMDSFTEKNGTPFHIFMIGDEAYGVHNHTEIDRIPAFDDYFEAEAFVEQTVHEKES